MENKTFLVTRDDTGLPTLTQVYTRWHRFKYAATGPSTQADAGLNTMTQNYTRSHRITHADTGLHTLTQDYTRSHRITHAHTGLHTLTQDYTRWHWITHAHTGLHALTQNYTRWHRIERQADTLVWQRERSANENDFTACWHSRYVTSAAWWTPLPIAPLRMRQCCRSITQRPKPWELSSDCARCRQMPVLRLGTTLQCINWWDLIRAITS